MSNYLLECEIVGGEVSPPDKKLVVKPARIYPKSTRISLDNDFGVLAEEDGVHTFNATNSGNFIFVKLDQEGFLILKIGACCCAYDLLTRNCSNVVLELELNEAGSGEKSEKDFTVVGFKVQF